MKGNDIIYQPDPVKSLVIVEDGKLSDPHHYLIGLLSSFGNLYAFIDKDLMMKSREVFELSLELQEMGCPMRAVEATEQMKTMDSVLGMCSWLMEKGADRNAVLLAIGGGITTDMVGFAASIYKRGVRYVSVPTTLLAQVDAGLGGKTGVNFLQYKNMLGAVHQPVFSFLWPAFLRTLPRRDFLSGAAELLKSFIISDEGGRYQMAVSFLKGYSEASDPSDYIKRNEPLLADIIGAAASVKAGVVTRDPFEKGERRTLNLGHTFAHAIETLSQRNPAADLDMPVLDSRRKKSRKHDVTHGEAVAMGMLMAARLAERIEGLDVEKGLSKRLEADMRACGLAVDCPFSISQMAEAMSKDKKAEGDKVHFVLPVSVGKVIIYDMTVSEACSLLED